MKDSINKLKQEIGEKQHQLKMISNLDLSKPVTKDKWFDLCKTPLRNTEYMGIILKNIFPSAKNIKVRLNEVIFSMYGFECKLRTSQIKCIEVETNWESFKYKEKEPVLNAHYFLEYYDLVDKKANWVVLANKRLDKFENKNIPIIQLFFMWFLKYKWKKLPNTKDECLDAVKTCRKSIEGNIEKNRINNLIDTELAMTLKKKVIPELEEFGIKIVGSNRLMSPYEIVDKYLRKGDEMSEL